MVFCSEYPDIPDDAGKSTKRWRRRKTQAIAKRYAFHANAKSKGKFDNFATSFKSHFGIGVLL